MVALEIECRRSISVFRLTANREPTLGQVRAYWSQIGLEAQARDADRILVVANMPSTGFAGALEAVRTAQQFGLDRRCIAYVGLREGARSFVEFGEILARNRGFNARVFDAEAEAEAWLLQSAALRSADLRPDP